MKSIFAKKAGSVPAFSLCLFGLLGNAHAQASSIVISEAPERMVSQNFRVDSGGFPLVPVAAFTVTSSGDENIMANFDVDIVGSASVRVIYLFEGGNQITAGGASDQHSDNLFMGVRMMNGDKRTFTVMVQFFNDVATVSPLAQARVTNFMYYNSNFHLTSASGTIVGPTMHLFDKCAQWSVAMPTSIAIDTSASKVTASFPLNAKALAGAVVMPIASDFSVKFVDIETGELHAATEVLVAVSPPGQIADGSVKPVTVTASLSAPSIKPDGLYHARIEAIKWTIAQKQTIQTWGLDRMVTGITNAVPSEKNSIGIIGSRLRPVDQTLVMAFTAPHQNFFVESSADLSGWTEFSPPIAVSEIAGLPNDAKAYRMVLPLQQERRFYRATLRP